MRFSTTQHPLYCGIDLHARTLDVCSLRQDGEGIRHRTMPATPDALLPALAPSRDALVLAVAWLLRWDWRAALGAQAGRPFVLGHALSRPAIHRGQTTNDQMDSQKIAGLLRGGMLPQAYVSPAAMRATRALRRRRTPWRRQRAAWRAHLHNTPRQYHRPASGQQRASKAHRDGALSGSPRPRCQRASQATARSWATTTSGAAPWRGPSSQRPRRLRPSRCPAGVRSPGAARAGAEGCARPAMRAPASRGAQMASRMAAASRARRRRRGSATGPRARRAATPISRGPSRKRRGFCSGPIPPATRP
jgi:hypothetical protein